MCPTVVIRVTLTKARNISIVKKRISSYLVKEKFQCLFLESIWSSFKYTVKRGHGYRKMISDAKKSNLSFIILIKNRFPGLSYTQ